MRGVWATALAGAVTVAALLLGVVRRLPASGHHIPFLLAVALFAMAELAVLRVAVGGRVHAYCPVEVPLVLGLLAMSPTTMVGAWITGGAVTLGVIRRQRPARLAYNLAAFGLEAVASVLVFRAFAPDGGPLTGTTIAGVLCAALTGFGIGAASVVAAGALTGTRPPSAEQAREAVFGSIAAVVTAGTILIAVVLEEANPAALFLLALPLAAAGVMARVSRPVTATQPAGHVDECPTHDPVTGLANRQALTRHLKGLMERSGESDIACVFVRVHGVEEARHHHGEPAADRLVVVAAQRLARCIRDGDVAARWDTTDLAVIAHVNPDDGAAESAALGRRIVAMLGQPASIGDDKVVCGVTVGITIRSAGASPEDLLSASETACLADGPDQGAVARLVGPGRSDDVPA